MMHWNRRLHGSMPKLPKMPKEKTQDPWEDPAMASIVGEVDDMYRGLIQWSHSYIELLEKRIQDLQEKCERCEYKRNCCDDVEEDAMRKLRIFYVRSRERVGVVNLSARCASEEDSEKLMKHLVQEIQKWNRRQEVSGGSKAAYQIEVI